MSKIWLIKPSGEKKIVDTGLRYTNGGGVSGKIIGKKMADNSV